VALHEQLGLTSLTPSDCMVDRSVSPVSRFPSLRARCPCLDHPQSRDVVANDPEHDDELLVSARGDDLGVEPGAELVEPIPVGSNQLGRLVQRRVHGTNLLAAGVFGSQSGRQCLKGNPQRIDLVGIPRSQRRDRGATVWVDNDKLFSFELTQGLSNREATDTQIDGKTIFDESGARGEAKRDNPVEDLLVDPRLKGQARGLDVSG